MRTKWVVPGSRLRHTPVVTFKDTDVLADYREYAPLTVPRVCVRAFKIALAFTSQVLCRVTVRSMCMVQLDQKVHHLVRLSLHMYQADRLFVSARVMDLALGRSDSVVTILCATAVGVAGQTR
jgi:hypothetical protein